MSFQRLVGLVMVTALISATQVTAQATFTPSYNAPYRAFTSSEAGVTLSFPSGADFGLEGQYRFGRGSSDVGLRAGLVDFGSSTKFVMGVEARARVLDHNTNDFPLDGAIIVGVGTAEFDSWVVPSAGLSLGRRVELEDFQFVAYGQPTLFVTTGSGSTNFDFGLGFGVDFKIGQGLDLRTSVGTFDGPEGVAFGFVWVR